MSTIYLQNLLSSIYAEILMGVHNTTFTWCIFSISTYYAYMCVVELKDICFVINYNPKRNKIIIRENQENEEVSFMLYYIIFINKRFIYIQYFNAYNNQFHSYNMAQLM